MEYNRLEGAGSGPGLLVKPWKSLKGSKNLIVGDNLNLFKTSASDVVLDKDSCNNLFVSASCKIAALGSNDLIQMSK